MKVKLFISETIDDEEWFCIEVAYEDLDKLGFGPFGIGQIADDTDAVINAWCVERFPSDAFSFERDRFFMKGHHRVTEFRLRWDGCPVRSVLPRLR